MNLANDGIYSIIIVPEPTSVIKSSPLNHEFILIVQGSSYYILHSYIGLFKTSCITLTEDDPSLLLKLISRLAANTCNNDDISLYNSLFNSNETYISRCTVDIEYYSDIPSNSTIMQNASRLEQLAVATRDSNWYDYYATLEEIYP